MADRFLTVRRFDGGLDTVTAPELLPPNKTPYGVNFSIEDTGSISRRSGYIALTATPMRASPMKALWRWYTEAGGRYWIAVCGTGVFTYVDGARDSYGSVEAETLTTSATAQGWVTSAAWASGGSAVRLTSSSQTLSASVPYSTYIRATLRSDVGMSVQIDGGAWSTVVASQTEKVWSGLSATTHVIGLKPIDRAANALKLNPVGINLSRYRRKAFSVPLTEYAEVKYMTVSFNDNISGTNTAADRFFAVYDDTETYYVIIGVRYTRNTGYYVAEVKNSSGTSVFTSTVPRSAGWHTATFAFGSSSASVACVPLSVDGVTFTHNQSQGTLSTTDGAFKLTAQVVARTSAAAGVTSYFDSLRYDGLMLDDFSSLTGWTGGGTAPDNDAIDTTTAETTTYGFVDLVTYQAQGSWTRRAAVSATASDFSFAVMDGKAWFGSDYDRIRSFDGASVAASSGYPRAGFLAIKQNRLFAAGRYDDKTLVEYTAIDKPTDWSNGGAIRLTASSSGGDVTGLKVWNDTLFYAGHSIMRALDVRGGEANWWNREVSNAIGCVAPRSFVTIPNGVVFLSADGVKAYGQIPGIFDQDGSGFLNLSEDIRPTLQRITTGRHEQAAGAYYQGRYYLSVPLDGSTTNSHTLVYRFADNEAPSSWTLYDWGVSCFGEGVRGDENALYGGDPSTGHIYRLEYGGNDNGDPIVMTYTVPPLRDDGYHTIKHFRRMYLTAQADAQQDLTIDFSNDDAPGATRTVSVDQSTDARPIRIPINARGRSLSMTFSTSGSEQDISISEVSLHFDRRIR